MKLDRKKFEEIIELMELVISDDIHLFNSLNNSEDNGFYSKEELQNTIDEISSEKMKAIFEKKITNFKYERKKYLMEKYGKFFLRDRLVRSTISKSRGFKKRYSIFKK